MDDDESDAARIAASARLRAALAVLDRLHASGEVAPVVLDDLNLMARLAGLLQRRRLDEAPLTIDGTVPGAKRQARVDQF